MQTLLVPSLLMLAGVFCVIGLAHGLTTGRPKTQQGAPLEPSAGRGNSWRLQMVAWLLGAGIAFAGAAVLWG